MIAEKEKKKEKKKEVSLDYGSTIITEISVPFCFLLSQSVYGSADSQLCTTKLFSISMGKQKNRFIRYYS